MTEIVKADKQLRKRVNVVIAIFVLALIFTSPDYFSNLINIDKAGMDALQVFEATQQELINVMWTLAFWFLVTLFFPCHLFISAKRTLNEKRYPPINAKVIKDTKVVYGRKAKRQAHLMIGCAILFLGGQMFRGYMVFDYYDLITNEVKSAAEWQIESDKINDQLYKRVMAEIAKDPNSIKSIEYYFRISKPDEAVKLMDSLIQQGSSEALFAKASESLKGERLPKQSDYSINTLNTMCKEYVEPCLLLAIYYKEQKQYDLSLSYFGKADSKDYIDVYREIRYLYNRLYLNDRDKLNEYTDKMNSAQHKLCEEIYCLTKH